MRYRTLAVAAAVLALAGAAPALAADDEFKLVIENHKFEPAEIVIPANKKVKLVIENRDATPEEFESKPLKAEKVIAGKSTASVFIGPLKPGSYAFVGEYNEKTAKGAVVVK